MKNKNLAGGSRFAVGVMAMALGLCLVFLSGLLAYGNVRESDEAGEYVRQASARLEEEIRSNPLRQYLSRPGFVPDYKLYPGMDMPEREIDGRAYVGELALPSLDMAFAVQSDCTMANLAKSPCVYSGTAYDGSPFTICAHNYMTHFWPIRELGAGDPVLFTDCDGNVFEYEVVRTAQLDPSPVSAVTEADADLVLFTCSFSGTKRIAVFCNLV